jgi:hypothetical protein
MTAQERKYYKYYIPRCVFVFSRISYGQSISTGWCSSVYAKFRLMEILLRRSSEWKALSTNIIIEAKKNPVTVNG